MCILAGSSIFPLCNGGDGLIRCDPYFPLDDRTMKNPFESANFPKRWECIFGTDAAKGNTDFTTRSSFNDAAKMDFDRSRFTRGRHGSDGFDRPQHLHDAHFERVIRLGQNGKQCFRPNLPPIRMQAFQGLYLHLLILMKQKRCKVNGIGPHCRHGPGCRPDSAGRTTIRPGSCRQQWPDGRRSDLGDDLEYPYPLVAVFRFPEHLQEPSHRCYPEPLQIASRLLLFALLVGTEFPE